MGKIDTSVQTSNTLLKSLRFPNYPEPRIPSLLTLTLETLLRKTLSKKGRNGLTIHGRTRPKTFERI